ncbi:Sec-independent protein translocase TatB [Herbiconiux liukaitaii]|uniref:Sec-independent protein translocase TatB n=1 Tax=Herbiconiux liukaitaii TaxID=3342799 RepID=UPI0035B8A07C
MFGLTAEKLVVIAVLAAFLIGPERLPHYAEKLRDLVRAVRGFTESAKARVAEEVGPEFDDVDWKKLDPRQYDPRQIVRDALSDDPSSASDSASVVAGAKAPAREAGWQQAVLARTGGAGGKGSAGGGGSGMLGG